MQGGDINGIIGAAIPDFGSPTLQGMAFQETGHAGVMEMKGTRRQFVKFYTKEFYNASKAEQLKKEGKELALAYEKKTMVKIVTPGDKTEIDTFASDEHKRAYPRQYKAFREGKTTIDGRSIEDIEFVQAPEATELIHLGIYTVEQLADASDSVCESLPRGFEIRDHAKNWCAIEHGDQTSKKVAAFAAELNESKDLIAKQAKALEDSQKAIVELRGLIHTMQSGEPAAKKGKDK